MICMWIHQDITLTADIIVVATFFPDSFIKIKNPFFCLFLVTQNTAPDIHSNVSWHSKNIMSHRGSWNFCKVKANTSHTHTHTPLILYSTSNVILFRICFAAFCLSAYISLLTNSPSFITIFYAGFALKNDVKKLLFTTFTSLLFFFFLFFLQMWANICRAIKCILWVGRKMWNEHSAARMNERTGVRWHHTQIEKDKNESGVHIYDKQTKNPGKITPIATVLLYWI